MLFVNHCSAIRRPPPSFWKSSRKAPLRDRKSTRLNSSHSQISYAVFCLKKKIILNLYPLHLNSYTSIPLLMSFIQRGPTTITLSSIHDTIVLDVINLVLTQVSRVQINS